MELILLTVCLTIPIGGAPDLTVYPVVEVSNVPLPESVAGVALPFLVLNNGGEFHSETRMHELVHHRQMRNLGFLSFFAAYALTGGAPFEDYKNSDGFMLDYPTYNACGGFL